MRHNNPAKSYKLTLLSTSVADGRESSFAFFSTLREDLCLEWACFPASGTIGLAGCEGGDSSTGEGAGEAL